MAPPNPEALLRHQAWIRRLALRLARDAAEADDLTQDTWLAALRAEADSVRDLRAWLGTLLRNRLRSLRRSSARASVREACTARTEDACATDAVVQRMQEQRVLLAALDALDEPYRTTLLLRFFEDLSPATIARRTGRPVETVKTHLKRGLARLRLDLEQRHGSREAWLGALVPLLRPPEGSLAPLLGTLMVKQELKLLALVLLIGGGALGLFAWQRAAHPQELVPTSAALVPPARTTAPGEQRPEAPSHREERAPTESAPFPARATSEAEVAALRPIPGRVFDSEGLPLGGVRVAQRGGFEQAVRTDADGRFVLPAHAGAGVLVLAEPDWITVFYGTEDGGERSDRILVAARSALYAGRVMDESGNPLAAVELQIDPPAGLRARFPAVLDYSGREYWITLSDEEGRFEFAFAPRIEGSGIEAERAGFAAARFELGAPEYPLELVLQRLPTASDDLRGRVIDEHGLAVVAANVAAGEAATQTDERGEFALPRAEIGAAPTLAVVKRGLLPVQAALGESNEYVLVRLTGPALTLSGRVRFDDDRPAFPARVWIADPSYFGRASDLGMEVTSEGLAAATVTREAVSAYWSGSSAHSLSPERFHTPSMPFWSFVRTDEHGRFRLEGLAQRDYRVRAMDERTLQIVEAGPWAAGKTDLELVLPRQDLWPRLAGRVLALDGQPIVGAALTVATTTLAIDRGDYTTYRGETRGEEALTDAEGRFELRDVPYSATVVVTGDHIERLEFGSIRTGGLPQTVNGAPDDVRIVVRDRYHLRIDYSSRPDFADAAEVQDEQGQILWCDRIEGDSTYGRQVIELDGGRSGSWNVAPEARTLVLKKGESVVQRLELYLVRRQENLIVP